MSIFLICIAVSIGLWWAILIIGSLVKAYSTTIEVKTGNEIIDFENVRTKYKLAEIIAGINVLENDGNLDEPVEVKFKGLSKKEPYVLFVLGDNKKCFAKAIIQGSDEKYKVEIRQQLQSLHCELIYETDSLWKKGCQFFIWPKIKKSFNNQILSFGDDLPKIKTEAKRAIPKQKSKPKAKKALKPSVRILNANYFELPVADVTRAKWFYEGVFGFEFLDEEKEDYWISHFKYPEQKSFGALVFGGGYMAQVQGPNAFIQVLNFELLKSLLANYGGSIVVEYFNVNQNRILKFIDSEGNRVGVIAK